MGGAGVVAANRAAHAGCPPYPVGAWVALAESVQSDELDARCAASDARPRALGTQRQTTRVRPGAYVYACACWCRAQARDGGPLVVLLCAKGQARRAVVQRGRESSARGDDISGACRAVAPWHTLDTRSLTRTVLSSRRARACCRSRRRPAATRCARSGRARRGRRGQRPRGHASAATQTRSEHTHFPVRACNYRCGCGLPCPQAARAPCWTRARWTS